MKDFLRKLLASLLCICMIGSSLPVSAIAEVVQAPATAPEQQTAPGDTAEEQGGQSAQTEPSAPTQPEEEQTGEPTAPEQPEGEADEPTAQTQEIVMEPSNTVNLSDLIMPMALDDNITVTFEVTAGNGTGTYGTLVEFDPTANSGSNRLCRLYFKITIKNGNSDPVTLKFDNTVDWNGKDWNGKKTTGTLYFPKDTAGGTNYKKFYKKDGSTYTELTGENDPAYTVTVNGGETVVLTNMKGSDSGYVDTHDTGLDDNSYISDTLCVWMADGNREDGQTYTVTAATKKYKDTIPEFDVTVEASTQTDATNYNDAEASALETVSPDESLVWWYTIKSTSSSQQMLNVSSKLSIAGVKKSGYELEMAEPTVSGASFADDVLTLPKGATVYLRSNPFPAKDHEGEQLDNSITVTNKDNAKKKVQKDTSITVTGEPPFAIDLKALTAEPDATTIDKGMAVQYELTITNNSVNAGEFEIGESVKSDETALDTLGFTLVKEVDGVSWTGENKIAIPKGETVVLRSTEQYIVPLDSTTGKQFANTVTVTETKSTVSRKAKATLKITDGTPFTLGVGWSIGGGSFREGDKDDKAKVDLYDDSGKEKKIQYRISLKNNTDAWQTFSVPTVELTKGNVAELGILYLDVDNSTGMDEKMVDKDDDDKIVTISIPPHCEAILKWDYNKPAETDQRYIGVKPSADTITIEVTAKCTDTGTSATKKLILEKLPNPDLAGFGYSMAIAGADFDPESAQGSCEKTVQLQNAPDGSEQEGTITVHAYKLKGDDISGNYIIEDGFTKNAGAKKYLTYITDTDKDVNTKEYFKTDIYQQGDKITITGCEPHADGYAFICWYDKYAEVEERLKKPGDTVIKNNRKPQTIDAIWMGLGVSDKTVVYDGNAYTVPEPKLVINAEDGEYHLEQALRDLGDIKYTVYVNRSSGDDKPIVNNESLDVSSINSYNREMVIDNPFGGNSYTEAGVYEFEFVIEAKGVNFSKTATLTILPRPVVVQAKSAEYPWDNKAHTVEENGSTYEVKDACNADGFIEPDYKTAYTELVDAKMQATANSYAFDDGDDGFADGESFTTEPVVKYFKTDGGSKDSPDESESAQGEYTAFISNMEEITAGRSTAIALASVNDPVAQGNYVFIPLDGTLKIAKPILATITLTKKVVDESFETGTFTFEVSNDDGAFEFVKVEDSDGTRYVVDGVSDATGDADTPIPLNVTATEGSPATASVKVQVPAGTYTFTETGADVTIVRPDGATTPKLTKDDYTQTYKTKDSTAGAEEDEDAKVTVEAGGEASVEVTNTANFYFVQNYISDLDDEGNPVKQLEGYPGYVASGASDKRLFNGEEVTFAGVHSAAKAGEAYKPEGFVDQHISSPNAAGVGEETDGTGGENAYTFTYDDENKYIVLEEVEKDGEKQKITYNANATYLAEEAHKGAVAPGGTVNIFWDRVLEFKADDDGRYVDAKVTSSNKTSPNAIRQSQIKYSTDYMLWTGLNNSHSKDESVTILNKEVKDSWQQVNAIDLTYTLNKKEEDYGPETPRYIFNTVVTTQVGGKNKDKPYDPVTISDDGVTIDNIMGGSMDTMLYLTPLIKVKYFIAGIDKDGPSTTYVDPHTYTLSAGVKSENVNEKVGEEDGYPLAFTPLDVPTKDFPDGFVEDEWQIRTFSSAKDGTPVPAGKPYTIKEKDLYHYSGDAGKHGIHVDPKGYLVVGLYLTPAEKKWSVKKEVTDGTSGTVTKAGQEFPAAYFGDVLTYTVTVKNEGNVPLSGLTLKDTPSSSKDAPPLEAIDLSEATLTDADTGELFTKYTCSADNKTITIDELAVGQSVKVTYKYKLPEGYKYIMNTASVDDTDNPDTPPETSSQTTYIKDWSVAKEVTGTTGGTTEIEIDGASKTVGVAHVDDTLRYEIKIANTGDVPLDELVVDDDFVKQTSGASGSVLTYVGLSSDTEGSTAAFNANKLTNLAVGETVTLTYTYKVASADQKLTNAVTVSDSDLNHERKSEEVVTPVTSFKVEKHVLVNSVDSDGIAVVKPGDKLTYEVVVTNTGSVAIESLTIEDVMAELESLTKPGMPDVTFTVKGSSSLSNSKAEVVGDQLKNLAAGETVTLQWLGNLVEGEVKPYPVADTDVHIRNTVTLTDGFGHAEKATADALVKNWGIEKSVVIMRGRKPVDGKTAQVGDVLEYTITVYNKGHEPLTLFIEDVLENVAVGVVPADEGFTPDNVTFDPKRTGAGYQFVEFDGKPYLKITNLPRADETTGTATEVTITYKIKVTDKLAAVKDGLHNVATAHGAKDPEHPETTEPLKRESDPHDDETVLVEAWTLAKELTTVTRNGADVTSEYDKPTQGKDAAGHDDPNALVYPAVRPGDVLTYTVTVENTGSAAIAKIVLEDVLTSGEDKAAFSSVRDEGPAIFRQDGDTVTLEHLPADSIETLTYTYKVKAGEEEGTLVNTVTVGKETKKTVTTEVKDWTVTKEVYKDKKLLADNAEVAVGDELTYVVTVKNTGTVTLTDLALDDLFTTVRGEEDGLDHLENKGSSDGVVYEQSTRKATIPADGKLVLSAVYTVKANDKSLHNAFTATDPDDETNAKKDEVTTQVRGWTVKKTVSKNTALPGNHLIYTIAVTNTGNVLLNLTLKDIFREDVLEKNATATEEKDITDALTPDDGANKETNAKFSKANKTITGLEPGKTFTLYWDYDVPIQNKENVEYLVNTVYVDDDNTKIDDPKDPDDPFPPKTSQAETHIKNWDVEKSIERVTYTIVDDQGQEKTVKRNSDEDGNYTLRPGDKVTYQVSVTNTGDETLTLYVEDSLFIEMIKELAEKADVDNWTDMLTDLENSAVVSVEGVAEWQLFEDKTDTEHKGDCLIQLKGLPIGGTATITYTYTVPEMNEDNVGLFAGELVNEVYVHANEQTGTDDKPNHNKEIDPHDETESPIEAWTLAKALTSVNGVTPEKDATVEVGDTLIYTITVKNVGCTDIKRLDIKDVFTRAGVETELTKDDLKKLGGDMGGARLRTDGATGGLYIDGLEAGEAIALTYTAHVEATDGIQSLVNTVTVTDGEVTVEKTVTTPVGEKRAWEVEKIVTGMTSDVYTDTDGDGVGDLQNAKVGDELTYQITVKNTGNVTLDGLTLEDVFTRNGEKYDQPLPIVQVKAEETSAVYANGTIDNLGVGETITLKYKYTVEADDIELKNTVTVSHPDIPGDPPKSEVTTPVEGTPAWTVEKAVYDKDGQPVKGEVAVGEPITYRITVTNTGNTMLNGLILEDTFSGKGLKPDAQLQLEQVKTPGSSAVYNDKKRTIDKLAVGETITLEYKYTVEADDIELKNTVTVSHPDIPGDPPKSEVTTPVEGTPAWTVEKAVYDKDGQPVKGEVAVGEPITYRITVTNTGNVTLDGLTLEDVFTRNGEAYDRPLPIEQVKTDETSAGYANGTIDGLGVGETITLECEYTVEADDAELKNAVTVKRPGVPGDPPESEVTTKVEETPAWTVEKTVYDKDGQPVKGEVAVGEPITYRIAVTNTGNVTLDGLTLEDTFNGAGLEGDPALAQVNAEETSAVYNAKKRTIDNLGVGETIALQYDYTVVADDIELKNAVTVSRDGATEQDDVTTPVKLVPAWTVTKQVYKGAYSADAEPLKDEATVAAGDTLTYVVTVTNTGTAALKNLKLTDAFQVGEGDAASGVSGLSRHAGDSADGAEFALVNDGEARVSIPVGGKLVLTSSYTVRANDRKLVNTATVSDPEDETRSEKSTVTTHVSGETDEKTETTNDTTDTTYNVTVHYLYLKDGSTAAPDGRTSGLRPGETYRFTSPTIEGYYASMRTASGTMPARDVEITVYYVPEDMLPADRQGGPGLILLDEYGIPLGVGRVMLNVGDCFE